MLKRLEARSTAASIEFGQQLGIARGIAGMSQADLAAKLGKAQGYVSRVENGSENLTLAACERFAWAVGCVCSSQVLFSFGAVEVKHRVIGKVTLATCERFACALGAAYSIALKTVHDDFTKK